MQRLIVLFAVGLIACNEDGLPAQLDGSGPVRDFATATPFDLALKPPVRIRQGDYVLHGVTDDNFVVVDDNRSASAIDLLTSTVQAIAAFADGFVVVLHKTVFVFPHVDGNGIGPLVIWSSFGGPRQVSSHVHSGLLAATKDGVRVAYVDTINGKAGDLLVDRTDRSSLVTATRGIGPLSCHTHFEFVGDRLIASYCYAGDSSGVLSSYDPTTGQGIDLVSPSGSSWAPDVTGARIVAQTGDMNGVIVPVGGGIPVKLATDFGGGRFVPDGSAIVYQTLAHGLNRVATSGGNSTVLQSNGVLGFYTLSDDGNWALLVSAAAGGLTDVRVANAERPTAAVTIEASVTASFPSFTDDSSYVVYREQVQPNGAANLHEILASPVGVGSPRRLATKASGSSSQTAGAGRLLFNDHYSNPAPDAGLGLGARSDLYFVDLPSGGSPALVAAGVRPEFFVTADKKQVVYARPGDGVYVQELP